MISREALVARLCRILDQDYLALLGQRGDGVDHVVAELRSHGARRGLRFLSLSLPVEVADPGEFQQLVLEGLLDGAARLPGGADIAAGVAAILREHDKRTFGYRLRAVLRSLSLATPTGLLILVVTALPEVEEERLKELLVVIGGFHSQRNSPGEPGARLRFLVVGGDALWRLCYHRKRDRSPFNIARRVLVGGLDADELARGFAGRSAAWLARLRAVSDGVPTLVEAIEEASGNLDDPGLYFGAIQDHWNALPSASRRLLVQHAGSDELCDCVPDYACPGVPEVDSPWMEAFWHGFLCTRERKLRWRSDIHRAFVAARGSAARRSRQPASTAARATPPPMKIFISYARRDKRWLPDIEAQLRAPERDGLISYWLDVKKLAGTAWEHEIQRAIEQARVAVLLVSPFFLASDFIANEEIPRILRRAQRGGLIVMPVILTSCRFAETKALSRYQAFNSPDEPLDDMRRPKRMKLLRDLINRVVAIRDEPRRMRLGE